MTYDRKKGRLILLFLLLFLTGCDLSPGGSVIQQTEPLEMTEEGNSSEKVDETEQIWVHVCGEVKNPGVYSLSAGSRVFDAIEAAGGFTKNADENSLNLASSLEDEGKIYVAGKKSEGEIQSDERRSDGKVNLNTATLEELMTLPGVGEVKARAILKLREEKGSFHAIEDLMEVDGIGEGVFQKIKDFITV